MLMPREMDRMLRYPRGRSLRLAKAGKLPCVTLPDGEIRFDEKTIERLIRPAPPVIVKVLEGEVAFGR